MTHEELLGRGFETNAIVMEPQWLVSFQAPVEDVDRIFEHIAEVVPLIMADAVALLQRRAQAAGEDARARYEILQLRFEDGLPIRDIAARWERPVRQVHDAYARARTEFYACLRETVALHGTASGHDLDTECGQLLDLLG